MELGRLQVLVSSQDVLRRFSSWTMLCIWASTHVKRTVQTRRVTALVMDASNNSFSDFMRDGKAVAPTILYTLKECLGPEIPDKVEMIYVVWHDGKIYVAVLSTAVFACGGFSHYFSQSGLVEMWAAKPWRSSYSTNPFPGWRLRSIGVRSLWRLHDLRARVLPCLCAI